MSATPHHATSAGDAPGSHNVAHSALAYARVLDALHDGIHTVLQHDALLSVGDLLGGRSRHGFHHDLKSALDSRPANRRTGARAWLAAYWLLDAEHIMLSALRA